MLTISSTTTAYEVGVTVAWSWHDGGVTSDYDRLLALSARVSRSVQTTVGWIFWDPGAVERYQALGLPEQFASPLGYIAARCAPLSGAGPDAVIAAFGSISPLGIRGLFDFLGDSAKFADFAAARDAAVLEGLATYTPGFGEVLGRVGPRLWEIVDGLSGTGRVMFSALRAQPRPHDAILSGWHAINAIREWRGDTHWALVVSHGLDHAAASILHNAWLGYEPDWLPKSRGTSATDLARGWSELRQRGFADEGGVTSAGIDLREAIEVATDEHCMGIWQAFGEAETLSFCQEAEPPCEVLLARVDVTAGVNYQPGSRTRRLRS